MPHTPSHDPFSDDATAARRRLRTIKQNLGPFSAALQEDNPESFASFAEQTADELGRAAGFQNGVTIADPETFASFIGQSSAAFEQETGSPSPIRQAMAAEEQAGRERMDSVEGRVLRRVGEIGKDFTRNALTLQAGIPGPQGLLSSALTGRLPFVDTPSPKEQFDALVTPVVRPEDVGFVPDTLGARRVAEAATQLTSFGDLALTGATAGLGPAVARSVANPVARALLSPIVKGGLPKRLGAETAAGIGAVIGSEELGKLAPDNIAAQLGLGLVGGLGGAVGGIAGFRGATEGIPAAIRAGGRAAEAVGQTGVGNVLQPTPPVRTQGRFIPEDIDKGPLRVFISAEQAAKGRPVEGMSRPHLGGVPDLPITKGNLIPGRQVAKTDLPETIYHVTSDLGNIERTNILRAATREGGGLGGGAHADTISFTSSRADADDIATELIRIGEVARAGSNDEAIVIMNRIISEDAQRAGVPVEAIGEADEIVSRIYGVDWEARQNLSRVEIYRAYLGRRETLRKGIFSGRPIPGLRQDPIIFMNDVQAQKIMPESVDVIEVASRNLSDEPLITDKVMGDFLHEIQVHGDVDIRGVRPVPDAPTPPVQQAARAADAGGGLRYDPATNRYNGGTLTRGDVLVDDAGDLFEVDRVSGFTIEAQLLDESGERLGGQFTSFELSDYPGNQRFKNVRLTGRNLISDTNLDRQLPLFGTGVEADVPPIRPATPDVTGGAARQAATDPRLETAQAGDRVTVFDPRGNPVEVTVTARSEAGSLRIRLDDGTEELLEQGTMQRGNANSPDYVIENLGKRVEELSDAELRSYIVRTNEKIAAHEAAGSAHVGTQISFVTDLNALTLEARRRGLSLADDVSGAARPATPDVAGGGRSLLQRIDDALLVDDFDPISFGRATSEDVSSEINRAIEEGHQLTLQSRTRLEPINAARVVSNGELQVRFGVRWRNVTLDQKRNLAGQIDNLPKRIPATPDVAGGGSFFDDVIRSRFQRSAYDPSQPPKVSDSVFGAIHKSPTDATDEELTLLLQEGFSLRTSGGAGIPEDGDRLIQAVQSEANRRGLVQTRVTGQGESFVRPEGAAPSPATPDVPPVRAADEVAGGAGRQAPLTPAQQLEADVAALRQGDDALPTGQRIDENTTAFFGDDAVRVQRQADDRLRDAQARARRGDLPGDRAEIRQADEALTPQGAAEQSIDEQIVASRSATESTTPRTARQKLEQEVALERDLRRVERRSGVAARRSIEAVLGTQASAEDVAQAVLAAQTSELASAKGARAVRNLLDTTVPFTDEQKVLRAEQVKAGVGVGRGRAASVVQAGGDPVAEARAYRSGQIGRTSRGQQFEALAEVADPDQAGDLPRLTPTELAEEVGLTGDVIEAMHATIRRKFVPVGQEWDADAAQVGLIRMLLGEAPTDSQRKLLRQVFGAEFTDSLPTAGKGRLGRAGEILFDVSSLLPKAIRGSMELSAFGRQLFNFTFSPRRAMAAGRTLNVGRRLLFGRNVRVNAAKHYDEVISNEIAVRHGLYDGPNKVELHDTRGGARLQFTDREEEFASNLIDLLPEFGREVRSIFGRTTHPVVRTGIRAATLPIRLLGKGVERSQLSFGGMMNQMRGEVGTKTLRNWEKVAEETGRQITPAELDALKGGINVVTGRGNLGGLSEGKIGKTLHILFWAPRLAVGRIQTLGLTARAGGELGIEGIARLAGRDFRANRARQVLATDVVSSFVTGATILGLMKATGVAEVETNPNSSDFGKGRIGRQRFDFWGGYQPVMRYIAQIATNEKKSPVTGESRPIGYDRNMGALITLGNFLRSKAGPGATSIALNENAQKNFIGEDLSEATALFGRDIGPTISRREREIMEQVVPLFHLDLLETIQDQGLIRGAIFGTGGFLGGGLQNFPAPDAPAPEEDLAQFNRPRILGGEATGGSSGRSGSSGGSGNPSGGSLFEKHFR